MTKWDVIVIGGGPAGMMAAGRAAELGSSVLLIEKNEILGKKLLITGGGRCNLTNAEFDNRKLLEKFKGDGKYLFSAFSQHAVKDSIEFFNKRNMETKIENEGRVFPITDKSESVLNVLLDYIKEGSVEILSNTSVKEIVVEDGKIIGVKIDKKIIEGANVVLATGGTSRPETGSTGDGFKWLKDIGHTVIKPEPSLVPIALKETACKKWWKDLSGLTLPDIKITVLQNNEKQVVKRGKILFTHVGVTGPTILNMSKDIGDLLKYGEVIISLDLLPQFDYAKLNIELQNLFKKNDKKKLRNALAEIIPSAFVSIVLEMLGENGEENCNSVSRETRLKMVTLLKGVKMPVDRLLGSDKAIISNGGVVLDEVDFKTMRSRKFNNLYLIGDILNIDRPSGGYSLQLCWTTGFVAGSAVGRK